MIFSAIAPLLNLSVDEESFDLPVDKIFLGKNSQSLNSFWNDDTMLAVGIVDFEAAIKECCFYLNGESALILGGGSGTRADQVAEFFNGYASVISSVFWFIKDNSVYSFQTFLYDVATRFTYRNLRPIVYTNACGEFDKTSFNKDELNEVNRLLKIVKLYRQSDLNVFETPPFNPDISSKVASFNYRPYDNTMSRISRSLFFLDFARGSSLMPQKISFYIAILECLFTTDGSEITHKVSERVAFYLKGEINEKVSTYELVKSAYGIRSKYVHGDSVKQKREVLVDVSVKVDNIIRLILRKVIESDAEIFLQQNDRLDAFFKTLILN